MKYSLFTSVFLMLLLASCQNDNCYYDECDKATEKCDFINGKVISIDEAVSNLESIIGELYLGTRANKRPKFSSSNMITLVLPPATRTSTLIELPDTLVYIQPFDDNAGYAILSARTTISPILAITESGCFDMNKFNQAIEYEINNNVLSREEYQQLIDDIEEDGDDFEELVEREVPSQIFCSPYRESFQGCRECSRSAGGNGNQKDDVMTNLCLILFLAVVVLWFFTNEYPTMFGAYVSARAVKRLHFKTIAAVFLIGAVLLAGLGVVRSSMTVQVASSCIDCQSLIIVLISSLIILAVLKRFSINGSVVYAVLGAFEAWLIVTGNETDFRVILSFVAAPAFAFLVSAILCLVLEKTLGRTHMHLISLSYYMRFAVIVGLALLAFALGLNWGGFLSVGASLIVGQQSSVWVIILVLVISMIALATFMRDESDVSAGRYADFTIYAVLSVGYAVTVTLLFFSFEASAGLLGLRPVPLSVGSIVFASISGVEFIKKAQLVERDDHAKEVMAFILAPLGSLVVAYLILHVSGNDDELIVDFTVMAAAIL